MEPEERQPHKQHSYSSCKDKRYREERYSIGELLEPLVTPESFCTKSNLHCRQDHGDVDEDT